MTWTKTDNIGPGWTAWNPSITIACDKSSPTTTECPGVVSGLSYGDCRYTTFNGQFYGFLNLSITNSGAYPYGGTRNHWALPVPFAVARSSGSPSARVGHGWWHTDTSPQRQGKVILDMYAGLATTAAFSFIKVEANIDQWAIDNLNYDWGWIRQWNNNNGLTAETVFKTNNSWSLRRLGSLNGAWGGTAENWSAPTPTITISVALNYMIDT